MTPKRLGELAGMLLIVIILLMLLVVSAKVIIWMWGV